VSKPMLNILTLCLDKLALAFKSNNDSFIDS
jgi:hypothetical protein